ncbi:hypothetical protein Glove_139g126 [Diversispora epigaea]|uniref:Uncharacterized protein n=1 Tax=Diversispora epigaea TaxID=1348612 RepID=A0A397IVT9_9GLOM|nr:hypothetical protein Glove_139g126 [Diversispora epigaea]
MVRDVVEKLRNIKKPFSTVINEERAAFKVILLEIISGGIKANFLFERIILGNSAEPELNEN